MRNAGYFRHPTVSGDTVVFVSEDDLWSVPLAGGVAQRLTAGQGQALRPSLSPDGSLVAFTSQEETHPEVFVMPATGGPAKRLTHLGAQAIVVGWTPDGSIVFRSDTAQPFIGRIQELWAIAPDGVEPRKLPFGHAHEISWGTGVVLGRNTADPARWKRYRGGTAGHLWLDPNGKGSFKRFMASINGNIAHPMWIGKRVYFVSDHEGIGNIYSARPDGKDLQRHTDHGEYYARFAQTDGTTIVYQHAADLYRLDVATGESERMDIDFPSSRTQRNRKFADAAGYLHSLSIHPDGHAIAVETRGKLFSMSLWEGAVRSLNAPASARHRLGEWLADGKRMVVVSDATGEEALEIHDESGSVKVLDGVDLGRVVGLAVNPNEDVVAVTNHRNELLLVDIATGKSSIIDRSDHGKPNGLAWSPDGAWLAYSYPSTQRTRGIKVADVKAKKLHPVTREDFNDFAPAWDPEGKYLYFLAFRTFDPVYDAHFFDLGFPRGTRPYVVTLRADLPSPFLPEPKGFGDAAPKGDAAKGKKKPEAKAEPIAIDFDGMADRIQVFPVPEARYRQIVGIKGKVLVSSLPVTGSLGGGHWSEPEGPRGSLEMYSFADQKYDQLVGGVSGFGVSRDGGTLVYVAGSRIRALKAGEKPDASLEKEGPSRKSGWIDLGRIRVSVDPAAEWRQMFTEAWRLQRDNFWTKDMSGINWKAVHARYLPLVDKVATRLEFSDLMWEMHGELGTSHAYEMGGDHRRPPTYLMGYLGADYAFDGKRWAITHIVRGDTWEDGRSSPLVGPGVNVTEGDTILAINGRALDASTPPGALLVHQAGATVEILVGDKAGKKSRSVVVRTLREEASSRYREWVEANREYVHKKSGGKLGYVHVPNMGPLGYSEFHRYYVSEAGRDGLLVDVRFNGGGHVSQIILEKLARKRIGYDLPRWGSPEPYPSDSVLGPMLCVTNEHAGSDGDIFTHCFKLMKLGTVVGKRTWGGVIGISPSHVLADNSMTTQPEYSFWFTDVGWGVENYGTDPDVDIDIRPQDFVAASDPQLDKGIELLMKDMKKTPVKLPTFDKRPKLPLPKLPKRS